MDNRLNQLLDQRIEEFRKRIEVDGFEFCLGLYTYSLTRLMACKYAYYIESTIIVTDVSYDLSEKDWYVMGRALNLLKEDEITPCVDFSYDHPFAQVGIALAGKLPRTRK